MADRKVLTMGKRTYTVHYSDAGQVSCVAVHVVRQGVVVALRRLNLEGAIAQAVVKRASGVGEVPRG